MKNKKTPHPATRQRNKPAEPQAGGERIAKRLARAGIASRRDAEAMVEAGRVTVNGRTLNSPAFNVSASDKIEVDGAPLPEVERTRLFLFNKPAGVVTTTRDPEGRRTVFDILPKGLPRLMTVGRLDINTEGLLLLTNDGGLARVLELPTTGWLRRYRVRVHGHVDPVALAELQNGIAVDGVFYGAIEAELDRKQGSNAWLTLGLREGKNREVKKVLGTLGLDVTRLIRVSYGPFQLGSLAEGTLQEIKGRTLRDQLGPRLVEEAGADFDAPVTRPFANKPVRGETPARAPAAGAPAAPPARPERKKTREEHREDMRERLQTKPPVREKTKRPPARARPEGKPGKGGQPAGPGKAARPEVRRSRASNVWMAPGARPLGEKAAAARDARKAEDKADAGRHRGDKRQESKSHGGKARGDTTREALRAGRKPPASRNGDTRPRPAGRGKPQPKGPRGPKGS